MRVAASESVGANGVVNGWASLSLLVSGPRMVAQAGDQRLGSAGDQFVREQVLLPLLERYANTNPNEASVVARFRDLLAREPRCLERDCFPGHVTASAWILSPDASQALLTHHRKLGRWLQLGGHVDGQVEVWQAALREAREESGMEHFSFEQPGDPPPVFDLDVHEIPARGAEPAHAHHDIRFLLRALSGQALRRNEESQGLRWVSGAELSALGADESVLRLQRKAEHWLQECCA